MAVFGGGMKLASAATKQLLWQARQYIDGTYADQVALPQLAEQIGFSHYHFLRLFQRNFAITPHQYLIQRRIERARELLVASDLSVTEICFAVGFQSLGSFSSLFQRSTGHAPSHYRRRNFQGISLPRRFVPSCYLTIFGIGLSYKH